MGKQVPGSVPLAIQKLLASLSDELSCTDNLGVRQI
jgi:hypothetical protein